MRPTGIECWKCYNRVTESVWDRRQSSSPTYEFNMLPYTQLQRGTAKDLRDWMRLSRPLGACSYSVFLFRIVCGREGPRRPLRLTAFKVKQSCDVGLIEDAARLPFCMAKQGHTSRRVFMLSFPFALKQGRESSHPGSRSTLFLSRKLMFHSVPCLP